MSSALVQSAPRAQLAIERQPRPLAPHGCVVVRIAAATLNALDCAILAHGILVRDWPWVGGNEYGGSVAAVGPGVTSLAVGDHVVASAVGFIEGPDVSAWQEYAILRADMCAKVPSHVPLDKASTTPTAFAAASIALALELGLKYPGPPTAPKKSSASVWEDAMAALGNGATFGWDLENGTVEGGVWVPKPKSHAIQGSLSPEEQARRCEAEREQARLAEEQDRLHAELERAMAEEIDKRVKAQRAFAHRAPHFTSCAPDSDEPWTNVPPMLWGAYDMSREAMDRRWGSGWDDGVRRFEVVGQRNLGLVTNGLGLSLGPRSSTRGSSTSGSASMGRSGSDSSTSVSADSAVVSHPTLPPVAAILNARRGSEPSLRLPEIPWAVGSAPALPANLRPTGSPPPRSRSGGPRPRVQARGSTSPFRIPATLSRGIGRGRGSPPYRVREQSPLGDLGKNSDTSVLLVRGVSARASFGATPAPLGAPNPWSVSSPADDTMFPPPLTRIETNFVMHEPILVWGGSTAIGRSALQLLKRAGYTNLFVVAASERHSELAEIAPSGTRFFDYCDPNVVAQIRTALAEQPIGKVLDAVSMPSSLEPISQLVGVGSKIAAVLPVNTPMPDGVEIKPVMFGRCNDYTGKDVLAYGFGKDKMWPLLSHLLRTEEWVFPPMVRLDGGLEGCAANGIRVAAQNPGKRVVFEV